MGSSGSIAVDFIRQRVQPWSLVSISQSRRMYYIAKRCLDVVTAALLLILLSPVLLVIAILVKIDSPGPVIFSQKRVGCKCRFTGGMMRYQICTFTFYKFRTMHNKADERAHREFIEAYIRNDYEKMLSMQKGPVENGNHFKLNGDRRITHLGKILRKTSLDELPQLWNVLKGDMSLVGPRPAIPYEVSMYETWHHQRLFAIPGMTGLWQTTARNSVRFDDMVNLDIEYIKNQSFWLDIKILLLTPIAVLSKKGN